MATSSSTSSTSSSFSRKYSVFLSFRGEDTRKNFVDHLYASLDQRGIYTFKDDKRLERGKSIGPELWKAIEESSIAVVIFSKNYASSSWCLDELVKIMESKKVRGQIVLPVFYDVDPSDVRKQKGLFGDAFAKHETQKKVGVWKEALVEAANLSGWEPKNIANGHEAQCIKKIVQTISLQLCDINSGVDENLIGIQPRMRGVKSSLRIGLGGVHIIGVWGMGGGGKTTVARCVFDEISYLFDGISFVENVREVSQKSGLQFVQQKVLSDVLKDDKVTVGSVYEGKSMIRERLRCRKVLVVLDDVDHISQLQALAGEHNWFGEESRIIITTRDEHVLVAHKVDKIHKINLLNDMEATQLVSRYAFGANTPTKGYEKPLKQVVSYAAGLPLSLKVLGSFLCGKNMPEWTSALDRLQKIPEKETLEKLKISFDGLEDDQQEMFLDIACFYRGWKRKIVVMILDACGFFVDIGLRVLEQKSLITFLNEECQMHDLIEEMGRNIVRKMHPDDPGKHSRLWRPEEVLDVLVENTGTKEIQAIAIRKLQEKGAINITEAFSNMKKLRLLKLNTEGMTFQVPMCLPNELRCLQWAFYIPEYFPESFRANKLVRLELRYSNIIQLWKMGETKDLKNLKYLDLSWSTKLIKTPEFTGMPNLKRLELRGCSSLVEVHTSIGNLHNLVHLNLYFCPVLKNLPVTIGGLECLETLLLSHCLSLQELPANLGRLKCLKSLHLNNCSSLRYLPKTLGETECLEELRLDDSGIEILPDNICGLKRLKTLNLMCCSNLKELPLDLRNIRVFKGTYTW